MSKQYHLLVGRDWQRLVAADDYGKIYADDHSLDFFDIQGALPEDTLLYSVSRIDTGEFCESCLGYADDHIYDRELDSYRCQECLELEAEDDSSRECCNQDECECCL